MFVCNAGVHMWIYVMFYTTAQLGVLEPKFTILYKLYKSTEHKSEMTEQLTKLEWPHLVSEISLQKLVERVNCNK